MKQFGAPLLVNGHVIAENSLREAERVLSNKLSTNRFASERATGDKLSYQRSSTIDDGHIAPRVGRSQTISQTMPQTVSQRSDQHIKALTPVRKVWHKYSWLALKVSVSDDISLSQPSCLKIQFERGSLTTICGIAALLSISLLLLFHGRDPILSSRPDSNQESRADLAVINAFGQATATTACARPTVRVSIGVPSIPLIMGLDPDPNNAGVLVWSPKIFNSETLRFLHSHPSGWLGMDTFHAGSLVSHRPGIGDESFPKGIPINLLILDNPMAYGCDGLIGISPFGAGNTILARFTAMQMSQSFLSLLVADSEITISQVRQRLQLTPARQLLPPDSAIATYKTAFSTLGVLHNSTLTLTAECQTHDHNLKSNVEVALWSVPSLTVGREGSQNLPTVHTSGAVIAAVECLCANDKSNMLIDGDRIDRANLCRTVRVADNSYNVASLTLPWDTTSASVGFGISSMAKNSNSNSDSDSEIGSSSIGSNSECGHGSVQFHNPRTGVWSHVGDRCVKAHWLAGVDSDDSLQYYAMFSFFTAGSLLWYLRDRLAPLPASLHMPNLQLLASHQLALEAKLELCTVLIVVVISWQAQSSPASTTNLHTSFTFLQRIITALFLSLCCTLISFARPPNHLEDCTLLSVCRSYAISGIISTVMLELGHYCVSGVARHALSIAIWAWNLRSQIDFVFRLAGNRFMSHSVLRLLQSAQPVTRESRFHSISTSAHGIQTIDSDNGRTVPYVRPPIVTDPGIYTETHIMLMCLLTSIHCGFFASADAIDVSLSLASVVLPIYGTHTVWLVTVIFVFDGANVIFQRQRIAENIHGIIRQSKKNE